MDTHDSLQRFFNLYQVIHARHIVYSNILATGICAALHSRKNVSYTA